MLQFIVTLAVVTATRDGLVDEVECFHLAATSIHHTLDPLVHRIDEGVVTLLCGLGNSLSCKTLDLDVLDEDVTHEVATLKHVEVVRHDGLVFNSHILPLCGEGNIGIFSVAPVAQFTMQPSLFCALDRHRHLVGLANFCIDILHSQELHIP